MRLVEAFIAFNVNCGKLLAQMVESTWLPWKDLGLSPMCVNCMIFCFVHCFKVTIECE